MTIEEHSLLILMFARQAILIKALVDILKSHELLTDEDIKLFDSYALESETEKPRLAQMVAELYSAIAKTQGLDVPVESAAK